MECCWTYLAFVIINFVCVCGLLCCLNPNQLTTLWFSTLCESKKLIILVTELNVLCKYSRLKLLRYFWHSCFSYMQRGLRLIIKPTGSKVYVPLLNISVKILLVSDNILFCTCQHMLLQMSFLFVCGTRQFFSTLRCVCFQLPQFLSQQYR